MIKRTGLGQGLLIIETSRSYSDTPQSLDSLWASDQPLTTYNTHKRLPWHRWD